MMAMTRNLAARAAGYKAVVFLWFGRKSKAGLVRRTTRSTSSLPPSAASFAPPSASSPKSNANASSTTSLRSMKKKLGID